MHKRNARLLGNIGLRESTLVLVASTLANGLNYLFNFCMNRLLSPQEYGALSALLALFMILVIPSTSARTVTVRYLSQFRAQGALDHAVAFLVKMLRLLGGYGVLLFVGLCILAHTVTRFLQLSSAWLVVVLATALLPAVVLPVAQGGLQGLQRFGALGSNMILATSSRLLVGVSLVWLGWGVGGALAASTVSGLFSFLCAAWMLRSLWQEQRKEHSQSAQGVLQYAGIAFWGILALTVLTNADVILVKHFFTPEEAGFYSTAATLGRIVLYLPVAIATVMFPKAVERHTRHEDSSKLARESLLATVLLCLPLVVLYFLHPVLLIRLLFGIRYTPSAPLVGPLGTGMAIFAAISLLLQYYLSIHDQRFVMAVMLGALGLVIGLCVFHSSLEQALIVLNLVGLGTLLIGEGWCQGLIGRGQL
jgi:O-antigen/teichoic acid export membrane protein